MNKVKVTREIDVKGDGFFCVSSNGSHIKAFYFNPSDDEMEEKQKILALKMAKSIESGGADFKETIYETEDK